MLRGRVLRAVAIPIAGLTLFTGCYRYVPVTGDLTAGGAYRGHLTPEGSQKVAPLVGANVRVFDGRIVSVLDTAYLVSMSATVKASDPRPTIWMGEQLVIPRSAVNRLELRQLDRPRTVRAALFLSAGIFVIGALVLSIKGLVGGDGGGGVVIPQP